MPTLNRLLLGILLCGPANLSHGQDSPAAAKLTLRDGKRPIMTYQAGDVPSPDPAAPWYGRSGFIHPVRTPAGRIVTNDFPHDHLHQHGLMIAWTSAVIDGKKIDFWNSKKKEGHVEHVETISSGPDEIVVKLQHVNDTATPPQVVLQETWKLTRVSHPTMHVFDLLSTQTCVLDQPISIAKYHYGSLCVRGTEAWRKDGRFLTSEGKGRDDGNQVPARWVALSGKVDGAVCGLGCLGHPSNFRAPQPARLHPEFPYFSFAPMATGEFKIAPGKPYVSRFRFAAFDGETDSAGLDALWAAFAGKP